MQEKKLRIAAYVRTSTADKQTTEAQADEIRAYAEARGWDVPMLYDDHGYSGKDTKRPAFQRLLQVCRQRKVDVVIATKLDRAFRSLRDAVLILTELQELGVQVVFIRSSVDSTTAAGKLMMQLLAAFSEFERQLIVERVKAGLVAARAKGRVGGRRKQRDDAAIARLREEGRSIREIASTLGISKGAVQASLEAGKSQAAVPITAEVAGTKAPA